MSDFFEALRSAFHTDPKLVNKIGYALTIVFGLAIAAAFGMVAVTLVKIAGIVLLIVGSICVGIGIFLLDERKVKVHLHLIIFGILFLLSGGIFLLILPNIIL